VKISDISKTPEPSTLLLALIGGPSSATALGAAADKASRLERQPDSA